MGKNGNTWENMEMAGKMEMAEKNGNSWEKWKCFGKKWKYFGKKWKCISYGVSMAAAEAATSFEYLCKFGTTQLLSNDDCENIHRRDNPLLVYLGGVIDGLP